MLRTLRSPFVSPRVIPFSFNKVGASFTDSYQGAQTIFQNDGNGVATLSYRDPFPSPSPIIVGSAVNTTATAPVYFINRPAVADAGLTQTYTANAAGTNVDLPCMGFAIGQDTRFTAHTGSVQHNVNTMFAGATLSAMYVDTPGGLHRNLAGASLTINGVGDTTITFPVSGAYPLIACVIPQGGTSRRAWIHSTTQNSIRVLQRNNANSAAEASPFTVFYVRHDNKTPSRGRKAVKTNQPEASFLFGRVRYTAGVPAWDSVGPGNGIGTIVDTGVGDLTINLPPERSGLRLGLCMATPGQDAANFCTVASNIDSSIRIRTWTIAGTDVAVDPTHIDFVALIYRNAGNFRG